MFATWASTRSQAIRRSSGTNWWIHPTENYDRNWAEFAASLDAPFPFLFVSFPSAKDPSFEHRYPERQTIQISTLAPYDRFAAWAGTRWKKRGSEYDDLKARLAERLRNALHHYVPSTAGRIVAEEFSTPLSTQHFANHPAGEIYGLAHTPARFADASLRPQTPVKNLYITGQDITICSVMGAFVGAVVTASAMLHRNLYVRLPRPATPRNATLPAAVPSGALEQAGVLSSLTVGTNERQARLPSCGRRSFDRSHCVSRRTREKR